MPTFVVETGAGLANANSYASVAEADAYHASLGNPTEWADKLASGTIQFFNQPANTEFIIIGTYIYTFKTSLSVDNDVLIGVTLADTIRNLVAAISDTGQNSVWHNSTGPNSVATAAISSTDSNTVVVTATTPGESGNAIVLSTNMSLPNRVLGGDHGEGFLSGGASLKENALRVATDYMMKQYNGLWVERKTYQNQALDWPRSWVEDGDQFPVPADVVPQKVKNACCYLALMVMKGDSLMVDIAGTDRSIASTSIRVGPISKSVTYSSANGKTTQKKFVNVDKMLAEFLLPAGRIWRA